MQLTARLERLALVVVFAWALTSTGLPAAPLAPGDDAKKTETPAEKIKKALDQTTDLELTEQPLHLAVAQLREQTKVNFVLDRQAIMMMGMAPEEVPISAKLKNVKLRSGLRSVLGPYNLGYAVVGDTVVITTDDMAIYRQLRQRVSVNLDKASLADGLKQLVRETGANLLLDPRTQKEAQALVTLQLDDVPLETAVRLLAEMAGLRPVRMGNVLFVTSKTTAAELRADPELFPGAPGVNEPGIGGIPFGPGGKFGGFPVPPALPIPPQIQPDRPVQSAPGAAGTAPANPTPPPVKEER